MFNEKLNSIEEALKERLDAERYHHTLGVMYTSAALAMKYGESVEKALLAGLLHDCAKCMPKDEKLLTARKFKDELNITDFEIENPHLLHGKLGVRTAKEEFGITDNDILNAVANHTKGRPGMSLLEKIIFTADLIEPGRDENVITGLKEIRKTAFEDIDLCVLMITEQTLHYLEETNRPIDQDTVTTYEHYKKVIEERRTSH